MNTAATATAELPQASSPVLHKAIHSDDLDAAFRTLQEALGVRSGDVAGMHCQKNAVIQAVWERMSPHQRADFLSEYVAIEASYSQ